jgi:hypothetical protein
VDDLARRPAQDRSAVFRRAAEDRGLPPEHVEKDFWVCWLLRRLYSPLLVDGMVLKGGTSLAKVWGAIHRFSEDIDLTLPRSRIAGADEIESPEGLTTTQRKKVIAQLRDLLAGWCATTGLESVAARIREVLNTDGGWAISASDDSMEFEYPVGLPRSGYEGSYVRPQIRLEFGVLMPTDPAEDGQLRPYADRAGRYIMADPDVAVRVLAPERTFWEKATLLHADNNRPEPKAGDRLSRHYADVATVLHHEVGRRALSRVDLLPQVARDKHTYFYTGWADYAAAEKGQLRLVPPPRHEKVLRTDYDALREMYYGEILPFDSILERLAELQETVASHPLFSN